MQSFVHFNVHSDYSVLEGQAKISSLVNKTYQNGMKALALTDHGNMFGFYEDEGAKKRYGEILTEEQKKRIDFDEAGWVDVLNTLSVIKKTIENIKRTTGKVIDFPNTKDFICDKKTYELFSAGKTIGVFQFESEGMRSFLKDLQPTVFEDLIALYSLDRPGVVEFLPSFIARKHGQEAISYDIPVMERYLKDTYGMTIYQEQIMHLSRLLANFTPGEADELRRAMGKKHKEQLDYLKVKFSAGTKANGYDPHVCEKIWDEWLAVSPYLFNKSHATCYSWIAFQTAYLKANYPVAFMTALLNVNAEDTWARNRIVDECKAMGIYGEITNLHHLNL